MTNKDIINLVNHCDLNFGIELVPHKAYLVNQKFHRKVLGKDCYEDEEIIVLVKEGIRVGGIYRMGFYDIHWVIDEQYRGQHILSDFLKLGIIQEIWPENKSVTLEKTHLRNEYNKKKYLAELCGMTIKNEEEIERFLSCFGQ